MIAQVGPDETDIPGPNETVVAKRVCAACEVRAECLQDALDRGERVWGGLSERERRALACQPSPVRYCPVHGAELSGGPVLWPCPAGRAGHRVTATDLETADEAGKDAA